jgi:hypothetical protein
MNFGTLYDAKVPLENNILLPNIDNDGRIF